MPFDEVRAEGVSKVFGRQRALAGVSLALVPGRLAALVGPNGAGKSTLVGVLAGLVRPSAGRVTYRRAAVALEGEAEIRAAIGLLAHEPLVYPDLTAEENLAFFAALHDLPDARARAAALLDRVGLDERARRRPARTYSRGMLQRLALARALLPGPRLLLLDEPFTGLDREGAAALTTALTEARADGRIVLVVTHDLAAVAGLADHLLVLRAGRLVRDEARERPFTLDELRERHDA